MGKTKTHMALLCSTGFFALILAASTLGDDHDALMALFKSTGGESWTTSTGWGSSSDMCTWFGVQCQTDGSGTHVISVVLPGNGLQGGIPNQLAQLKQTSLYLPHPAKSPPVGTL